MKIIFSSATLSHGGAERVISILANSLVERGYEIEILLYYDRPIWYEINSKVVITNDEQYIGKANPIKHMLWRHKYLKNSSADVIVSFLAPINIINILAMIGIDKSIIVADRNDPRKTPFNPILRIVRNFLYRFADMVVLQSDNNKNYFSKKVKNQSAIIFNPVDVGEYARKGLDELEEKEHIIAVGRLIEQKNPYMLLRAFSLIADEFPNLKLTFYGEGELKKGLEEESVILGIKEKVQFPGAVQDIYEKVSDARLYVMTSEFEGMPNALIEAMCIGVPVISTKVSGATDLIENNVNGMLIDCQSEEQLVQAMRKMLGDVEFARGCALEAVKLNQKLAKKQIIEEWLECINKLI